MSRFYVMFCPNPSYFISNRANIWNWTRTCSILNWSSRQFFFFNLGYIYVVYSEKKLLWIYARNPYIRFLLCLMCVQVLKQLPEKTKQFNDQICFYATFSLKDGQIYPNRNIIPWLHPCLCQCNHCRASANGHSPCLTSSRFRKLQRTIKQPRWRWFFFSQLFSFQHWINNVNPFWVTAPCFFFPFRFFGPHPSNRCPDARPVPVIDTQVSPCHSACGGGLTLALHGRYAFLSSAYSPACLPSPQANS